MNETTKRPRVIITGGGSGIGAATARLCDREGFGGALVGRRPDALEAVIAELSEGWMACAGDIRDPSTMPRVRDEVMERMGRIDALVNNAGCAPQCEIGVADQRDLLDAYEINALGTAYAIRAIWPSFVAGGHGCIVNVSSMASMDPFPGFFAYAGSKAAVNLMAKSSAMEGAPHNIRAFSVAPGAVETGMLRSLFDESVIPKDNALPPEKIAEVIVECLKGQRDSQNGETIVVASP